MKAYPLYFMMCALLLSSCAGSRRIEIATVAIPSAQPKPLTTPEQVLAEAAKHGTLRHQWISPIAPDGTFTLDRQKPVSYVTEYSAAGKPEAYDMRQVGVKFRGRVNDQQPNLRGIELEFAQCDHTGTNVYGPGIEQPVFESRSISTTWIGKAGQWQVLSTPANAASEQPQFYVLARAN